MFAMISATRDEKVSSTSTETCYCEKAEKHNLSLSSLYETVHAHRNDAKLIKNLLVNLQNKLTMMDSHIEISFESIKTKIN